MGLAKADGLYQGNGRARLERMFVLARLGHFLNDIAAAIKSPNDVALVNVHRFAMTVQHWEHASGQNDARNRLGLSLAVARVHEDCRVHPVLCARAKKGRGARCAAEPGG
jgi:hypothetical protein